MSSNKTAHDLTRHQRTHDIKIDDDVNFDGLLLSDSVLLGLKSSGFERPSPVQLKAIPLGRCGLDLVVQAKSGTGKTCVFAVVALEGVILDSSTTQVLIVAPTREIAVQIWEVINAIGSSMPGLRCYTFIGGMPVSEDTQKLKKCHIAVGTPGRVKQLMELGALCTNNIRLFVLDEADKLMEEGMQDDINWLYSQLPDNKQMLALSATYPEVLAQHLTVYMRNPTFIRLNSHDPALLGIRQYYRAVLFHPLPQKAFSNKVTALKELLSHAEFRQCLVFSNYQLRAQSLADQLTTEGWPATCISGAQDQQHRLTAMARLKRFKCRVLVSTDLTSRGIDAEHVNLVVNLDLPHDHETYLHRIGRAGRFGTYGAAVTFVTLGREMDKLKLIEEKCKTNIKVLPAPIPPDLASSSGYVNINHLVITERINNENGDGEICSSVNAVPKKVDVSTISDAVNDDAGSSTKLLDVKESKDEDGVKCSKSSENCAPAEACINGSKRSLVPRTDVSIFQPDELLQNQAATTIIQPEDMTDHYLYEKFDELCKMRASVEKSQDSSNTSVFCPSEVRTDNVDNAVSADAYDSVNEHLVGGTEAENFQAMNWSLAKTVEEFDDYMKEDSKVSQIKKVNGIPSMNMMPTKNYPELLDHVSTIIESIRLENEQLLGGSSSRVREVDTLTQLKVSDTEMLSKSTLVCDTDVNQCTEKDSQLSVNPDVVCESKNTPSDALVKDCSSNLQNTTERVQIEEVTKVINSTAPPRVNNLVSSNSKGTKTDSSTTCRNRKVSHKHGQTYTKQEREEDVSLGKEYMQLLKCKDAVSESDEATSGQSGYITDSEEEVSENDPENSHFQYERYLHEEKGYYRHKSGVRKGEHTYPEDTENYWEESYNAVDNNYYRDNTNGHWKTEEYYGGDWDGESAQQQGYQYDLEQDYSQYEPEYVQHHEHKQRDYGAQYGEYYQHGQSSGQPEYSQEGSYNYTYPAGFGGDGWAQMGSVPGGYVPTRGQQAPGANPMSPDFWAGWQSCQNHHMGSQPSSGLMSMSAHYKQLCDFHRQQADLYNQQYEAAKQQESFASIYHSQKNYIRKMAKYASHLNHT